MYRFISWPFAVSACLLLVLMILTVIASAEGESRPAVVLLITRAGAAGSSRSFQQIISNSMRFELERSGLQVISVSDLGTDFSLETLYRQNEIDEGSLQALARQLQADFVIAAKYSGGDEEILLDLSWYDVEGERFTASNSKTGKVDLSLDRFIGRAIAEILTAVDDRLAAFSLSRVQKSIEADGTQADGREAIEVSLQSRVARRKHLEISTGFSPFLATGEVSEYFKIGYLVSLQVNYRINLPSGQLGIGIYSGINLFRAEGVAASSDNFLIPIGADFRYVVGNGFPLGLFIHIGGGPAIFMLNSAVEGRLSKVIPYVMGGIGLSLPFTDFLGIAVDMSYAVFFEKSTLIMGFTPSVYINFSF